MQSGPSAYPIHVYPSLVADFSRGEIRLLRKLLSGTTEMKQQWAKVIKDRILNTAGFQQI